MRLDERIYSREESIVLSALSEMAHPLIGQGQVPEVPRFHADEIRLDRTAEQVRQTLARERQDGHSSSDVPPVDRWLAELILHGAFKPPLSWREKARELLATGLRFGSTYPGHAGIVMIWDLPDEAETFCDEWTRFLASKPERLETSEGQLVAAEAMSRLLEIEKVREKTLEALSGWPEDATLLRIALHAVSSLSLPQKRAFVLRAFAFPELHNTLARKLKDWAAFREIVPDEQRWIEKIVSSLDPRIIPLRDPIDQARFGVTLQTGKPREAG